MELEIFCPAKLIPVFQDIDDQGNELPIPRYRAAHGGRGSAKSRTFATQLALRGVLLAEAGETGLLVGAREYMNSLADSSFAEIKAGIEAYPELKERYEIGEQYIRTKDKRIEFAFAGLRHNLDSIKSKARIHVLWVDEAEKVSENAWQVVTPTVREHNSEIWVTWNPERKGSATDLRFRSLPYDVGFSRIVEMNWRDNPKFPSVLELERQNDLKLRPESYEHIWEGGYKTFVEGAYFTKHLIAVRAEKRIGKVPIDPLMTIRLFADIGGTGAKADSFVFVAAQFIGREIRVIDHYEAQGQDLATHVAWLRGKGYTPDRAQIWLPHDGSTHDKVFDVSYESALRGAGYSVTVVPNQGKGAAMARVEKLRQLFPAIWFNEETTQGLIDALSNYHEKIDEIRKIGLGPDHDWSSHSCLLADTLIMTDRGEVEIQHVVAGDKVLTPAGYAVVEWSGITKLSTELIDLELPSGHRITCTPEHKIFTTRGVLRADELRYNDSILTIEDLSCISLANANKIGYRESFIENTRELNTGIGKAGSCIAHKNKINKHSYIEKLLVVPQKILNPSLLMVIGKISTLITGRLEKKIAKESKSLNIHTKYSMESNITCGLSRDIIGLPLENSKVLGCIGQYGNITMERYQKDSIFITLMKTKAITQLKILKCCQSLNMLGSILKTPSGLVAKKTKNNLKQHKSLQKLGINQTKAKNGTVNTLKRLQKTFINILSNVFFVVKTTKQCNYIDQSIVQDYASKGITLKIRKDSVPVYDLTVKLHHCFFANGILVSNCDAFGLMAVCYEEPKINNALKYIPYHPSDAVVGY